MEGFSETGQEYLDLRLLIGDQGHDVSCREEIYVFGKGYETSYKKRLPFF